MYAKFVITDSGGIHEETTVLNIPCLTLRDTAERPVTISRGTNVLVGTDAGKIIEDASRILGSKPKSASRIELWDGMTAEMIVDVLTGRRLLG